MNDETIEKRPAVDVLDREIMHVERGLARAKDARERAIKERELSEREIASLEKHLEDCREARKELSV